MSDETPRAGARKHRAEGDADQASTATASTHPGGAHRRRRLALPRLRRTPDHDAA